MKILIEEDLHLELINEAHSEDVFKLIDKSRVSLALWLPWVPATRTVSDTSTFIKESLKRFAENSGLDLVIVKNNTAAGIVGVHKIDHQNKVASIGYWLGEEYQGKGFMTKCCGALVKYCFDELLMNYVEIKCATGNLKSQAIPVKLGFEKTTVIKNAEFLNGNYVDHVLFQKSVLFNSLEKRDFPL